MAKTIIVVGANRGIGLQLALQYLKKGHNVYGTYRRESAQEAEELLQSGAKTMTLDLTDENSIDAASKTFGDQPLDLLINCAAAGNGSPNWIDATAEEFMTRFRVSVVRPFLTVKSFYPQLKKSASSLVLNMSSSAGSISGNESGKNMSYRTSKAGLNMVTMNLARELAADNIRCIAMSPGWVQTKMSGFTGPMQAPEAASRMIDVIEGFKDEETASFWHRDGYQVGW